MLAIIIKALLVGIILTLIVKGYKLVMSGRNGWIVIRNIVLGYLMVFIVMWFLKTIL